MPPKPTAVSQLSDVVYQEWLTLRPPKLSGGHPTHLPEMTRQVALVREARGESNLR